MFQGRHAEIIFYVVKGGTDILGIDAIQALRLHIDEAGHECQAKCSVCNGAHITGSVECKWKYRRAIGGQRERSLVRNTDISYSQGPHNINPRRSSASPSRGKNGKPGLPDTPSAHPETGADNHRNKAKESSHPAARGHPPGKKNKHPNQRVQADKERELQKVIERSVQSAIEESIRDTIERTIQAVLEPRLLMLLGLEVKLDRKLQEHDKCTRAKVPKLSGRKTSKRTDRCDSWGTGEEPQDYNLQEQDG
ncbi:hypothetical protein MTO96_020424 [Rhipicephalus appendiculatus]